MFMLGGLNINRKTPANNVDLNLLLIKWNINGNPTEMHIKEGPLIQNLEPTGELRFSQNMANKKYFPEHKTWCFIDLKGVEHTYNICNHEFKSRNLKSLPLQ